MLLIFEGDRVFFVLIDIHSLTVFVGNCLYDECDIAKPGKYAFSLILLSLTNVWNSR